MKSRGLVSLVLVLAFASREASCLGLHRSFLPLRTFNLPGRPNAANCTTRYFDQAISHFDWSPTPTGVSSFKQRYLVCSEFWKRGEGPVFFYTGNEGDVTLYANATGLMWENAEEFGALLVFAEHRYYGTSLPFGSDSLKHLQYLTSEQALADYAVLIEFLKKDLGASSCPFVAFGGSYGGMLSSWFRIKYPDKVVGAIAASAPVRAFVGATPAWDTNSYWRVVTRDATAAAGAKAACADNVRSAWPIIFEAAKTDHGRERLSKIFRLCHPMKDEGDGALLALMLAFAFDTMAMGNFPYPSNYLTSGGPLLPAWPVRVACDSLGGNFTSDDALLAGLRDAAAVFANATKDLPCFTLPPPDDEFDGIWDYQWCTEMLPQETYFAFTGTKDMFWSKPFDMEFVKQRCAREYNVQPRPSWIPTTVGDDAVRQASNIVYSNGLYDPWSAGGVLQSVSESVVAVIIEDGAHHLDLMFSDPLDPESVKSARKEELAHIRAWIDQARDERRS